MDQFEYYTLETDTFWKFKVYPDGRQGIYWKQNDGKANSHVCYSKLHLTSAIKAVNNEANGIIPALFTSANLKPVKFTGESTIYLVSNNNLTTISNEQIYS
ncbi:hypothetical protein KAI92_03825, partial [Candidatus Parcubacteria bacterium]|nr:hypothetical protein [Candidatus Parcubacteria bacterium]